MRLLSSYASSGRLLGAGVILAALAAAAPAADAGPRLSCRLVTDAAGDTSVQSVVPNQAPELDILSADVATDARWLTVVVRVAHLDIPESGAPPMRRWSVLLTTGSGVRYIIQARQGVDGIAGDAAEVSGDEDLLWTQKDTGAHVGVHLDTRRAEVRISLLRAELGDSRGLAAGARISGLRALSWYERTAKAPVVGLAGLWDAADEAVSSRTYTAGSPSCVKPGS